MRSVLAPLMGTEIQNMDETVEKEAFEAGFGAGDALLEGLGRVGGFDSGSFKFHRDVIERGFASDDGFEESSEEFFRTKVRADALDERGFLCKKSNFGGE